MITERQQIIKALYRTFAHYPLRPTMDRCPCCVLEGDIADLCRKPLSQLTKVDLAHYTAKAITTWGDVEDFKQFLPRILDLLTEDDQALAIPIVLDKLKYANWWQWPKKEEASIREFLLAWWTELVTQKPYFDSSLIIDFYQVMGTLEPLLDRWSVSATDFGFHNLIEFINRETPILLPQKGHYKGIDDVVISKLKRWLVAHLETVEQAFYHYEKTDKDWAELIAAAYDKLATVRNSLD